MTQEQKKLLLKDLCTRLPYGITIYRITDNSIHRIQYSDITENIDQFSHFLEYSGIDNIKPFLRPMSSMTEDEKNKINTLLNIIESPSNVTDEIRRIIDCSHECIELIDFYIKHHLDYHGLIPLGIALEAPKDMYTL